MGKRVTPSYGLSLERVSQAVCEKKTGYGEGFQSEISTLTIIPVILLKIIRTRIS